MIDRIEELLGPPAAEDEEEQENVPALPVTEGSVPAFPREDEGETGDSEVGDRSGGKSAGETMAERTDTAGELWRDGPVWTVRGEGSKIDEVQATAGRVAWTESAVHAARDGEPVWVGLERATRGGPANAALESLNRAGAARDGLEQAGLKGLYRQTVRGLRPAAPALPPEKAGITARAQEPGIAASLAVDELDRAVRRDSRRYDGGMSIY